MNGTGMPGSETSILARHLAMSPTDQGYSPVKNNMGVSPVKKIVPAGVNVSGMERIFSCDMCSAKLKNKRNFETHMKRHRGELPFKCEECPMTFQGRRDLETHKRSRHEVTRRARFDGSGDLSTNISKSVIVSSPSTTALTITPAESPSKAVVLSMNGFPSNFISD